jgi:hypothetical protein
MSKNDLFYSADIPSDGLSTKVPVLFITTLCNIKQILVINW